MYSIKGSIYVMQLCVCVTVWLSPCMHGFNVMHFPEVNINNDHAQQVACYIASLFICGLQCVWA